MDKIINTKELIKENTTKLMKKLLSNKPTARFNKKIVEKLEEARKNGSAEYIYRWQEYQVALLEKDYWIIEDKKHDEVTEIDQDPNNSHRYLMTKFKESKESFDNKKEKSVKSKKNKTSTKKVKNTRIKKKNNL